MGGRVRDILLVLLAAGLIAIAVVPWGGEDGSFTPQTSPKTAPLSVATDDEAPAKTIVPAVPAEAAAQGIGDLHVFWPMAPGGTWTYRVEGPEDLVLAETWTATVKTAPDGDEPGEIEAGFGDERRTARAWMSGGSLLTDVLPLMVPMRYAGSALESPRGAFLGPPSHMIEGSVWDRSFEVDVEYRSTDRRGASRLEKARGTITDRATLEGLESVIVAAGRFDTIRVSWIGRIELRANGRKVLAPLTSAPYRREVVWLAMGVGMVRRRVELEDEGTKVVTFDLISYRVPSPGDGR